MYAPYELFTLLAVTITLFIIGYWRYDVVAFLALIVAVILGLVPVDNAFTGFSNPAVITVACVMVISYAITQSGVLNFMIAKLTNLTKKVTIQFSLLIIITAFLSAFMNNVGALALMMPVAMKVAIKGKQSPSIILMPLAFGSVLGGLTTVMGTPPNLLIAAYRQQMTGHAFAVFDYTPVGIIAAIVGLVFIIFIGWRLMPARKAPLDPEELFHIEDYITEIKVPKNSSMITKKFTELPKLIEGEISIIGFIRQKKKHWTLNKDEVIKANDILIIQASHRDLEAFIKKCKFKLLPIENISSELLSTEDFAVIEAVVPQGSRMDNRSAQSMRIKSRFGINLIAIARQGKPFTERLQQVSLKAGDVALLQGSNETLQENTLSLGLLPLVERGIKVSINTNAFLPIIFFAIAIILTAFRLLPIEIAFSAVILSYVLFNIISIRTVYENIDWSIIILLASMIPIGHALQTTGATALLAHLVYTLHGYVAPVFILAFLFIITMTLSDVMNNAAVAVMMAPIAVSIARILHVNIDPFLMTVAVSSSCSFLTPISHQNNTLVMGPGGYKFSDYFKMGLALEIILLVVCIPAIVWIWPLS